MTKTLSSPTPRARWAGRLATLPATLLAVALAAGLVGPAAAQMPPNPPVQVALPLTDEVIDYDVFTGRFVAAEEVELRARVSGYLAEQRFADGALVERDQVLFVIDQRPFAAALDRADAAVASAEAGRTLAEIELQRALQLAERNVGTVQEVDRTRATLLQDEANVKEAEAARIQAQLDLEFTTIRAPFPGRMSAAEVDVGNLIVGGTSGTTLLGTLVRVAPIHFVFTGSEADFLRYSRRLGMAGRPSEEDRLEVAIRLLDEDDFVHGGYIDFVDNRLGESSGTIEVRAIVDEPEGILTPGLFGRLRVAATDPYQALLVPDDSILSDQAIKIVLTVDDDNVVVPVPVEIGPLHRGLRAIAKGLEPDARVIVAGAMRAQPGSTVTPQETELAFPDSAAQAGN